MTDLQKAIEAKDRLNRFYKMAERINLEALANAIFNHPTEALMDLERSTKCLMNGRVEDVIQNLSEKAKEVMVTNFLTTIHSLLNEYLNGKIDVENHPNN